MTVLSNGSQTGKTSHEKELVLVQVGKNVIPVCYVVAWLEMAEFSETDVISLKKGLDSLSSEIILCWITKQN